MNFIVAIGLLFLEPEDAFWLLVAVTEKYFANHYFDCGLIGAQADQECLKEIVFEKFPELHAHFQEIDIEFTTITLNWFIAIFFDAVPFEVLLFENLKFNFYLYSFNFKTLIRIWDCFLLEGSKVLFRFSCALLAMNKKLLLEQVDTISVLKQLKQIGKLMFDSEGLIKVLTHFKMHFSDFLFSNFYLKIAFEDLKPFPRRKDIAVKQAYYFKCLAESWKRKQYAKHIYLQDRMVSACKSHT